MEMTGPERQEKQLLQVETLSDLELESVIQLATEELHKRNLQKPLMRITWSFSSYNQRRYSSPWIAKIVSWEVGKPPQMEFGRYLGTDKGGDCEIMARSGDIIRSGQKDYRKPKGTVNDWNIVQADGSLGKDITESEAREHWEEIRGNSMFMEEGHPHE